MTSALLKNSYNKSASIYNSKFKDIQSEKYDKLKSYFSDIDSKKNLLDLGCGTALFYSYLQENFTINNLKYHGIDFSEKMIQQASLITKNVIIGDVSNLPYSNNYFNIIVSFTVIGLTDDSLANIFSEIYRVLKNNGICIITILSKLVPGNFDEIVKQSNLKLIKSIHECGQDKAFVIRK